MTAYKQNLHTHTLYCDGKNTAEEMVLRAIELGFDTIGLSGHSYTGLDIGWDMSVEGTEKYKKEVSVLKEKYADRITVLCGIERDMLFEYETKDFDYVIGSVHFLKINSECVEFDSDAKTVSGIIENYFDGDGMKYAKKYYECMAKLYKYGEFDIAGHFDIIAKHCEKHDFFDVESKEYKNAALEALHSLSEKKKVFEVNTGAISRGYRTTPYPAPFILKEMKTLGCTVVLTSDCHDRNHLDCYYTEALDFIRTCGFDSIGVMKNGRITEVKI